MTTMASLMDAVLAPGGLTPRFQPILQRVRGAWRLHALEALIRGPRGTNLERADVLFEYVRRKHEEQTVDRACITRILDDARLLPGSPRISINVHASTLGRDREFLAFLERAMGVNGIMPSNLIVEIVEHSPYWDTEAFVRTLSTLRDMGVRIALDDVGRGQSNYRMILECRPDYLKLDAYLVAGSHADFYRRALLRSLSGLAESFGAHAVAEGIDNAADLGTVLAEGFSLVQGYYLARPASATRLASCDLLLGGEVELLHRGHGADRLALAC